MNHKNTVLIFVISICLGCTSQIKGGNSQESHIDTNMFEHHYVTQDLPGEADWGYGCPAMADFDKDGDLDYAFSGREGLYWFEDHIHSGFFPWGVGDLDGDGDNDLVLPNRWMENENNGTSWKKHQLPFGKRGRYGLSSRSWIIDLDKDGDNDIVVTDSDQQASRVAWLENDGNNPPAFTANFLPMTAPGIRGSFHFLFVGDFDNDGDQDIFTCDQEDDTLPPEGAFPRWYIWENISKDDADIHFVERVIFDGKLGGHDALVGDVDGDGDLDIYSKVWNLWPDNANEGREHGDFFENKIN